VIVDFSALKNGRPLAPKIRRFPEKQPFFSYFPINRTTFHIMVLVLLLIPTPISRWLGDHV